MNTHQDDPLAPAIRRTLQGSRTDCPDAGTIAAYAERALADSERRDVERHLSHCARCRETLLLMSRAAEEEKGTATIFQEAKKGGSPLYRWPWLAGAAAAGLAIVIWRALPPSTLRAPEPAPVAQVAGEVGKEGDVGKEKAPIESERAAANKAPVVAGRDNAKAAPSAPPPPVGSTVGAKSPRDRQAFEEKKRLADADRRDEPKLEGADERRARVQAPAAAQEPLPPVASLPETMAPGAATARAPARKPDSGARDTASQLRMSQQRREYMIASAPPAQREAAAAGPAIAWRVWASGMVERSVDGGTTWTWDASVDAPAARAVHAPTADVCWIVGDRGLILRFETRRGWTRLSPPAQVGFVAVEAPDAMRATITAADGRRFTTTDAGQTWK